MQRNEKCGLYTGKKQSIGTILEEVQNSGFTTKSLNVLNMLIEPEKTIPRELKV